MSECISYKAITSDIIMEIISYLQPMYQKQILNDSKYKNKKIGYTEYLLYYRTNLSVINSNIFEDSFDIIMCKEGKIIQLISTCIRCEDNMGSIFGYQILNTRFLDTFKSEKFYPDFEKNYIDTSEFYKLFTNLKDDSLFYSTVKKILDMTNVNHDEINKYIIEGGLLGNSKFNKEYIISVNGEKTNEKYLRHNIMQEFVNHINKENINPYNLYNQNNEDSEEYDSDLEEYDSKYDFQHVAKNRVDSDLIYFKKTQY